MTIKTYLVKSSGELLMLRSIVRKGLRLPSSSLINFLTVFTAGAGSGGSSKGGQGISREVKTKKVKKNRGRDVEEDEDISGRSHCGLFAQTGLCKSCTYSDIVTIEASNFFFSCVNGSGTKVIPKMFEYAQGLNSLYVVYLVDYL